MTSQPPAVDDTRTSSSAGESSSTDTKPPRPVKQRPPRTPISQILREINWVLLLAVGLGTGLLWTLLLIQQGWVQILAGLLPVTGGILVGRRIKKHITWHAVLLGLLTSVGALTSLFVLGLVQPLPSEILQLFLVGVITLLPFPAFGVITAARSEERNRELREQSQTRGGRLDRPGRVREIGDLQALSLPQLGGFVADLFRKHGFLINDYRFEKDRLDLQMSYEGEPWLVRVLTAEKVKPGVPQELSQRMKAEDVKKGVVITSMDFQDTAHRWAKDKLVALIDGETLMSMRD